METRKDIPGKKTVAKKSDPLYWCKIDLIHMNEERQSAIMEVLMNSA